MTSGEKNRRGIRSYVIREGRMTDGQRRALEEYWPRFGLSLKDGVVSPQDLFGNNHCLVVEVGFGMGDSLFETAVSHPDWNFIGIEVHRPGVGHLLIRAQEASLGNLKVYNADSVNVLGECFPRDSIDCLQVFFPDPWHKKRHHKRRLIDHTFVELLVSRLKQDGIFHVATDWAPYAASIVEIMDDFPQMKKIAAPRRPLTKYERRGVDLEHDVVDLAWQRSRKTAA